MKVDLKGWTPVALTWDIPKGGVIRSFVEGQDLAVWRSMSGLISAWDNRCPHRGMRLSHGFVRGESLTCIYHGWRYGTDGVCRQIPAHPDLTPPTSICTKAFACVEKAGLIWVSVADVSDEPDIDLADADWVRSMSFDQNIATVASMLADARFPIIETAQPGEGQFATVTSADQFIVRVGKMGEENRMLIAALQPMPDDRTKAHVLTSPAASPGLKTSLSRWLERFRWFSENPDAETRSWRPTEAGLEV